MSIYLVFLILLLRHLQESVLARKNFKLLTPHRTEPDFASPIKNVTVAVGREAQLSCVVANLSEFKVGWMKADTQTILSLHNKVVTHNNRVSVTYAAPRTWNLHIRQVQEEDRGCYTCQINTSTMKKTTGCIDVHVPPDIIDSESSNDVIVTIRGDASLKCVAKGYPPPSVTWRREDNEKILLKSGKKKLKVDFVEGSTLNLTNVSKRHIGAYLCIANNGVPPGVVKRIEVNVHFTPTIEAPNQLVGAPLYSTMELKCLVEASPKPITFWQKENTSGEVIMNSSKFTVSEIQDSYKYTMILVVRNLTQSDYGLFLCIVRNSKGNAQDQIRTYEIEMRTQRPQLNIGIFYPPSVQPQIVEDLTIAQDNSNHRKFQSERSELSSDLQEFNSESGFVVAASPEEGKIGDNRPHQTVFQFPSSFGNSAIIYTHSIFLFILPLIILFHNFLSDVINNVNLQVAYKVYTFVM